MKYLTVGLVVASAIALLGTGCHKDPYAPYAVHTVLEPDSLETFAGELPSFGIPTEYITHYREPHWLLVRMALDAESALVLIDADEGTTTEYCNRAGGGYDGPPRLGWANDVGQWDIVDGRLYLRTSDDAIASCGADGAVERLVVTHAPWPLSAVMTDQGFLDWHQGDAQPVIHHWVDGQAVPVTYDGPTPIFVTKRRDAKGLVWLTEADGALTQWNLDADTLAVTQVFSASLGGATVSAVWNVEPGSAFVVTDQGWMAATSAVGGPFRVVTIANDFINSARLITTWPDGRGFSWTEMGISYNLAEERALVQGYTTPRGQHVSLYGDPPIKTVDVFDNTASAAPTEPVISWTADLSTGWDDENAFRVQDDATYEVFGFGDGLCLTARWGSFYGMGSATSAGTEVGGVTWPEADSALYLGPCGEPGTWISQGLEVSRFNHRWGGAPVLKTDIPIFSIGYGVRHTAGIGMPSEGYQGVDVYYHGWGMASDGAIVPLFRDASDWMPRRLGGIVWTRHERTMYLVDAEDELR